MTINTITQLKLCLSKEVYNYYKDRYFNEHFTFSDIEEFIREDFDYIGETLDFYPYSLTFRQYAIDNFGFEGDSVENEDIISFFLDINRAKNEIARSVFQQLYFETDIKKSAEALIKKIEEDKRNKEEIL